jgi:hypothetical protein
MKKPFFDFKKWVKSIQTAGYNGARTVYIIIIPSPPNRDEQPLSLSLHVFFFIQLQHDSSTVLLHNPFKTGTFKS